MHRCVREIPRWAYVCLSNAVHVSISIQRVSIFVSCSCVCICLRFKYAECIVVCIVYIHYTRRSLSGCHIWTCCVRVSVYAAAVAAAVCRSHRRWCYCWRTKLYNEQTESYNRALRWCILCCLSTIFFRANGSFLRCRARWFRIFFRIFCAINFSAINSVLIKARAQKRKSLFINKLDFLGKRTRIIIVSIKSLKCFFGIRAVFCCLFLAGISKFWLAVSPKNSRQKKVCIQIVMLITWLNNKKKRNKTNMITRNSSVLLLLLLLDVENVFFFRLCLTLRIRQIENVKWRENEAMRKEEIVVRSYVCRWTATLFVTDNNVNSTVHRHYNCHGVCSLMNRPIFSNAFYLYLVCFVWMRARDSCVCINRLDLLISFAYRFRWLYVCVCILFNSSNCCWFCSRCFV